MKILIAGGTGFIGKALCKSLIQDDHDITVVTRNPQNIKLPLKGIGSVDSLQLNAQFDVVINLTGEPIADKRWSEGQKRIITNSRIASTQQLINFMINAESKPKVFISGSAIGIYGITTSDEPVDEMKTGDGSFSSQLCTDWEAKALEANELGIRTCLLRTGIVLGENGGALRKMLLPFKLGAGGKIGSGKQWMPWIHVADVVSAIRHCMIDEQIIGPVNIVAPKPVTNAEFTRQLGKALNRPTLLPMPAFVVSLLFGQMGEELLLSGKKVIPQKLTTRQFKFQFNELELALTDILK